MTRSNARARAIPWPALLAVVLWGASFVAVRLALTTFHPVALTATRFVLGTVFLLAIQRYRRRPLLPAARDLPRCALLGLLLGVHLSVQAYGLTYTSAVHTGWIIGFTPVAIALGAQLVLRKGLSVPGWLGVAIATFGVLFVTATELPDFAEARFGDFLQLSTCFSWAVYTLAGVGLVERNGALRVTAFAMGVAAVVLMLFAWGGVVPGLEDGRPMFGAPTLRSAGAVLFLGILCSGVALTLWYRSQAVHGTQRTGATLYLEPFVTLAAAMLILEEPFELRALLGGAAVLVGVWLVGRGARG